MSVSWNASFSTQLDIRDTRHLQFIKSEMTRVAKHYLFIYIVIYFAKRQPQKYSTTDRQKHTHDKQKIQPYKAKATVI